MDKNDSDLSSPKSAVEDDVLLSLRLPAQKCYLQNAITVLEGLCEHYISLDSLFKRASSALDLTFLEFIEYYSKNKLSSAFIDLKFSVCKDRLNITVMEYTIRTRTKDSIPVKSDKSLLNKSKTFVSSVAKLKDLADDISVAMDFGTSLAYSLQFNLT